MRSPLFRAVLAKFAISDILIVTAEDTINMPTRNISLTDQQDAYVEKLVKSGEYQNASEALRDALRALEQRRREDELKLKALRMQIKAGIDAIKRDDFVEIEESHLDDYLEGLEVPGKRPR
jgi:antitoxin ParD1/3/4